MALDRLFMVDFLRRSLFILLVVFTTILSEFAFVLATVASAFWMKADYPMWLLMGHIALTRFRLGLLASSKRHASKLLARAELFWMIGTTATRFTARTTFLVRLHSRSVTLARQKNF